MTIEQINKEIIELSVKISNLEQQKKQLKIEQSVIWAGSIVKCWNNYDSYEESIYKVVLLFLKQKEKFALLDTNLNIIWEDKLFESIQDIRDMMKSNTDGNWEVVDVQ